MNKHALSAIFLVVTFFFLSVAHCQTFVFTGNGNWHVASNWANNTIPPSPLPAGDSIIISPATADSCVLDSNQTISPGAFFIISQDANFIIHNSLLIQGQPLNNAYEHVDICNKKWMKKNLSVGKYRNGDSIIQVADPTQWAAMTVGAFCYYQNDSSTYGEYGVLYNWYAVNDLRGLAPEGWHVASDSEWTSLIRCVDPTAPACVGCINTTIAATALQETGTTHWDNGSGTNTTGFTALGAGQRNYDGSFGSLKYIAGWWSKTAVGSFSSYVYVMSSGSGWITTDNYSQKIGFSVRCVKD